MIHKGSKLLNICKKVMSGYADEAEMTDYYKLDVDFRDDLEATIIQEQKYLDKQKNAAILYQKENPKRVLWNAAKSRATKFNIPFDLVKEDINIPEYCPYLGFRITNIRGMGKMSTNASIDRVNNSRGYVKDNIMIISNMANVMKQNATIEQLIDFAKGVLNIHCNISLDLLNELEDKHKTNTKID